MVSLSGCQWERSVFAPLFYPDYRPVVIKGQRQMWMLCQGSTFEDITFLLVAREHFHHYDALNTREDDRLSVAKISLHSSLWVRATSLPSLQVTAIARPPSGPNHKAKNFGPEPQLVLYYVWISGLRCPFPTFHALFIVKIPMVP